MVERERRKKVIAMVWHTEMKRARRLLDRAAVAGPCGLCEREELLACCTQAREQYFSCSVDLTASAVRFATPPPPTVLSEFQILSPHHLQSQIPNTLGGKAGCHGH